VQRNLRKTGIVAAIFVGTILLGCSKKENYSADTSAAGIDTTSAMTASSTAPVIQDTANMAATSTKSTTKKSTGKTAPKKPTY